MPTDTSGEKLTIPGTGKYFSVAEITSPYTVLSPSTATSLPRAITGLVFVSYSRSFSAVIRLADPVSTITPIKLATTGTDALERPGRLATVTGWGNTIQQEPGPGSGDTFFPDRMRVAQVPIVADDSRIAPPRPRVASSAIAHPNVSAKGLK